MANISSKKIAICFGGLPRLTSETEKTWLDFITKYNADVFVHTWIVSQYTRNHIVKNLINVIKPKQLMLEPVKNFDISSFTERIWPYRSNPQNVLSMWYSINQSIQLCLNYDETYDIICRARFDWLCSNLELINALGLIVPDDPGLSGHHFKYKGQSYIGHNDQFGYSSPEIMSIYSDTFNKINQLYNEGVDFCSELFLTANMISEQIPITYQTNLNYRILK